MLGGFPAKKFEPLPRLLNRKPITRMIPVMFENKIIFIQKMTL